MSRERNVKQKVVVKVLRSTTTTKEMYIKKDQNLFANGCDGLHKVLLSSYIVHVKKKKSQLVRGIDLVDVVVFFACYWQN